MYKVKHFLIFCYKTIILICNIEECEVMSQNRTWRLPSSGKPWGVLLSRAYCLRHKTKAYFRCDLNETVHSLLACSRENIKWLEDFSRISEIFLCSLISFSQIYKIFCMIMILSIYKSTSSYYFLVSLMIKIT